MTQQHRRFPFSHLTLTINAAPTGWLEVCYGVPGADEHGPPFFLSYARSREGAARPGNPDEQVEKFFHELWGNVSELIDPPRGVPPGFMDREMQGGVWWTDELMHAVGTCQVLVALLSARYLRSEWCRMEWYAFTKRSIQDRDGADRSPRQSCILPVIWAPVKSRLPDHIRPALIFHPKSDPNPRVPGQYEENGVLGLMRMGEPRNFYQIVAWQLAMTISDIYHSQQTEPRVFKLDELRECLAEGGT